MLCLHVKNEIQTYIHKVASLDHEIFDHTMKCTTFVANWDTILPIFTRAKLPVKRSKNLLYKSEYLYRAIHVPTDNSK